MAAAPRFYVRDDDPPAKREILSAALKLFSRRGLAATSIRDIAEESGYTNPALYKHFESKEELALHLFETCHARIWTSCAEDSMTGRRQRSNWWTRPARTPFAPLSLNHS